MKNKFIYYKILFILSIVLTYFNTYASTTLYGVSVQGYDLTNSLVYLPAINSGPPLVRELKGGSDKASADIVYIPVAKDSNDYLFNLHKNLPAFNNSLTITLLLDESETIESGQYYHVAINNVDTSYYVAINRQFLVGSRTAITFSLSELRLDDIADSSSKLDFSSDYDYTIVYIFKTDSAFNSSEMNIDDYSGGHFIKLMFSSRHYESAIPKLNPPLIGDSSIKLQYEQGSVGEYIYSSSNEIFNYAQSYAYIADPSVLCDNADSDVTLRCSHHRMVDDTDVPSQSHNENGENLIFGGAKVTGLLNNQKYYLGISLVNKYSYASLISNFVEATPLEIQAFLNGKSCYLISAGFQQEHYVLEYFRHIRDRYLLKTELGSHFVSWYYTWSPQAAQTIIDNPSLAKGIRGMAYTLYFLMNNSFPILFSLFTGIFFIFVIKRRKYPLS